MKKKIGLLIVSVVAVMAMVGVVSAQEQPPTRPDRPGLGQRFPRLTERVQLLGDLLQIVADDLGVERADLVGQLRGQTLVDVIAANGGDVDQITVDVMAAVTERVNQAVADGNLAQARADQILSNLDELVQNGLNGELRDGIGRPRPLAQRPFLQNDTRPLINAAVDTTGLTGQEIVQELRSGKTLANVITETGGSPDAVIADAIAQVKETLDPAVANGRLTQEQEDAMLNGLEAFYDAFMNGSFRPQASTTL